MMKVTNANAKIDI